MRQIEGNKLTLLRNGEQYFPALVAQIDAARSEVFLETYIFAGDETGSLIADALARAAARGVAVRLLVDGFGSIDFPQRFERMLLRSGVELHQYRPVRFSTLRRDRLRRMHRKLACIDGRVAFVGGINIVDDFENSLPDIPRLDYAVRIEGPLTAIVRESSDRLWRQVVRPRGRSLQPRAAPVTFDAGSRAALVIRDSLRHRRDIEHGYLDLMRNAREEIVIASAYFLPGRRFRRELVRAAQRGVRVVLLLQGRVEFLLLHLASRAMYGQLLDAGVEIWEYRLSNLHAKVAVFDRRHACVGSSNLDPYSLLMALEANVFVDDARFASELRTSIEQAIVAGAVAIPQQHWRRRPFLQRLSFWFAHAVTRLLVAFAGYERYH